MKRERTPISRPGSVPRSVTPPVVLSRTLTGAEARLRTAAKGPSSSALSGGASSQRSAANAAPPVPSFTQSQLMEVNLMTLRRKLAEAKAEEAKLAAMAAEGEAAIDESVAAHQLLQDAAEEAMGRDAEAARAALERVFAATQAAKDAAAKARGAADESAVLRHVYAEEREELLRGYDATVASFDALLPPLDAAQQATAAASEHLIARQGQATLMRSSTYGLSADAAACVLEDERITKSMEAIRLAAIATEVQRRQQFSLYEELKGTIRVYCRVKGVTDVNANFAKYAFPDANTDEPVDMATALDTHVRKTMAITASSSSEANEEGATAAAARLTVADAELSASARASELKHSVEKRSLTLTQTRLNATSTGTKESPNTFQYDRVYGPSASQEEVFADVGPLVDCAVDGFRVCIMAYGQTGSGKTYTMEGAIKDPTAMGIIPRAIEKVFDRAAQLAVDGWATRVVCYFVEIYNDTIRDLLETSDAYHRAYAENSKEAGKAHEIQHRGRVDTVITNVKEVLVTCPQDIHRLLAVAVSNRSVARTNMNERSSRSHYVFTMRIEGINERINQRSLGSLCLVDLAGSERVNDSGAQGQRLKEAVNINKSLSFLGDCIVTLGSGGVVSWRICRLTYLLQNYLGGEGAKVLMIVNVSEREEHTAESLNTLRFATKVNQTHIAKATKRVQQL